MRRIRRFRLAAAVLGGLLSLGFPSPSAAQQAATSPVRSEYLISSSGSIEGSVSDDKGMPIEAAIVSAIGTSSTFAVTDRQGQFQFLGLTPGTYHVRAYRAGYAAIDRPQHTGPATATGIVAIALQRVDGSPAVLAAGFSAIADLSEQTDTATGEAPDQPASTVETIPAEEQGEKAWRLRHARRSILRDATLPGDLIAQTEPVALPDGGISGASRFAANFFADLPLSGQVNFLTMGSFDAPRDLFSAGTLSRGITYLRVGAPVGNGDWTVRGAVTESDISSWILAGAYATREPSVHRYDLGLSYSTQRYDGGNPMALREVTDGSRNVGTVYAFDTFALTPALSVTYGGRYAEYDYLEHRGLFSPKFELEIAPDSAWRLGASVSRQSQAPGAEEFLPPGDSGIWLPPQRTFSSLEPGRPMEAERTTDIGVTIERDIAASTVAFRAFRQHVDDQMVTVFGAELPLEPDSKIGHYFVGNAGDIDAVGCSAALSGALFSRLQGSFTYSTARVGFAPPSNVPYLILLAPSAARAGIERIHDVSGSIEADVPETSTHVLVLYRVSNGFARAAQQGGADRPGFDRRFDVQVRQTLPFLDSSNTRLEMLIAVRNFFREAAAEQAIYDELLAIRPPKRIVGGVTLHF
jgi:hypothetical protein